MDEYGAGHAVLTWLLPARPRPFPDSDDFRLEVCTEDEAKKVRLQSYLGLSDGWVFGPNDETLYSLDSLLFECHCRDAKLRPPRNLSTTGRCPSAMFVH